MADDDAHQEGDDAEDPHADALFGNIICLDC